MKLLLAIAVLLFLVAAYYYFAVRQPAITADSFLEQQEKEALK